MAIIEDKSAPGTVHLIDATGELHVKHSEAAHDIVLVPLPSDDPEDPLNWSRKRKLLQTSCVIMYTVMMVFPSSAVYSVTTPIAKATHLTVSNLVSGTGAMFLFYGWGCIVWQALALQYGKRPAYLISMAGSIIIMGLAPSCTTNGPYLANKILQGFFGAPVESLCEISMTDICLAASGKFAPVFAALINTGQGWKWTLWWCAIGMGVAFVYCFFLMEETNYDRHIIQSTLNAGSGSSSEDVVEPGVAADEKSAEKRAAGNEQASAELGEVTAATYPRKTYWQKLGVIDKKRPNRLLDIMWSPFRFFRFPVVVWAGFIPLYTKTYGFNSTDVGFAYFGAVVAFAGPRLVIRLARRNKGIAEPEHILWLFLASLICVPFAMLLWGLGAAYRIHWFGLVFAQAILAISSTLCLSTAVQYATSSYRDLSGEFITTVILIRNTLSFAINYGITPWIEAEGQRNTFITVAAIALVCNGTMFIMIRFGKRLRESSAEAYWRYVDQARAKGLSH
ncbi:major facilitator superfamily transporter [Hyaloscypha finlandica]|nr:major facilitator superfamily transporter [Hyaloscypha finlandica]